MPSELSRRSAAARRCLKQSSGQPREPAMPLVASLYQRTFNWTAHLKKARPTVQLKTCREIYFQISL